MRALAASFCALLLAACGSAPRVPDWKSNAAGAIDSFQREYLAGNTLAAERDLRVARTEVASTGRLDFAARVELIQCAVATAALDFDRCRGIDDVAAQASPEDRAYAGFLRGRWDGIDAGALPSSYRGVVGARDAEAQSRAMQGIEDPLSRLVAAGVLLERARITPAGVATAVDTSSSQGWRRAVLAWLAVQAKLAESAGDQAALATIRKRIDLAGGTAGVPK